MRKKSLREGVLVSYPAGTNTLSSERDARKVHKADSSKSIENHKQQEEKYITFNACVKKQKLAE